MQNLVYARTIWIVAERDFENVRIIIRVADIAQPTGRGPTEGKESAQTFVLDLRSFREHLILVQLMPDPDPKAIELQVLDEAQEFDICILEVDDRGKRYE